MNFSFDGFSEYRCGFIHVPKTGGTSVAMCLFDHLVGHHKVSELNLPKDYFLFAFVRHPLARLISAYEWYRKPTLASENDKLWAAREIDPYPTFSDWVMGNLENCLGMEHFLPQSHWLDKPVHFIGRYKYLALGVDYVRDVLGITRRALPYLNVSVKKGYEWDGNYFTKEAEKKAREIYAVDFERFCYE